MAEIKYIGEITLKSLRDVILDSHVAPSDAIFMHPEHFDEIALEYRETYNESITYPFIFMDVYINASQNPPVPLGKIRIERSISIPVTYKEQESYPPFTTVYRCGWCGNIVYSDGSLLDDATKQEYIRIIQKFGEDIKHVSIHGKCCEGKS